MVVRGRGGAIIRALVLYLCLCALFTVINGYRLEELGFSSYGLEPFAKSLKTAIVPLFIAVLIITAASVPLHLSPSALQRTLGAAFIIAVAYCAFQVLLLVENAKAFDRIWLVVEGARGVFSEPNIVRFGRLNGPTMEPAELAKLIAILFVPWLLYPAAGRIRPTAVLLALSLMMATLSIIGMVLALFILGLLMVHRIAVYRFAAILFVLALTIATLFWAEAFIDPLISRLSDIRADDSIVIRATYNQAALSIIAQNPIIGIGWSNEVFLFGAKVAQIGNLWEVGQDLAKGNALTAKSLALRLTMYGGVPFTAILILAVAYFLAKPSRSIDVARARFTFGMLAVGGLVDGGILTSFFLWAGPALSVGMLVRARLEGGDLTC